jgi:hypothetical protein
MKKSLSILATIAMAASIASISTPAQAFGFGEIMEAVKRGGLKQPAPEPAPPASSAPDPGSQANGSDSPSQPPMQLGNDDASNGEVDAAPE